MHVNAAPAPAAPVPVLPAPASAAQPAAVDDAFEVENALVQEFRAKLQGGARARDLADSLMPIFSKATETRGPIEQQVYMLLLRVLAKVEAERRKQGLDRARLDQVQGGLRSEGALKELAKVEKELDAAQKNQSEDQGRATEALMNAVRTLNDALLGTLRKA